MILEEFLKVFEIDAEIDLESDSRKEYHGKIVDLIDSKDFKKFKNLFVIDVCLMIQFEKIKDVPEETQIPVIFIRISKTEESNGYFDLLRSIESSKNSGQAAMQH